MRFGTAVCTTDSQPGVQVVHDLFLEVSREVLRIFGQLVFVLAELVRFHGEFSEKVFPRAGRLASGVASVASCGCSASYSTGRACVHDLCCLRRMVRLIFRSKM